MKNNANEADETIHLIRNCLEKLSAASGFTSHTVDMRETERKLDSSDSGLLSVLSDAEADYLDSVKLPKNRIQWISGRYAVKQALFQHKLSSETLMDTRCVDVLKNGDSAPYIPQYPSLTVSITHSQPYCIGVVSESRIGVDLERLAAPEAALIHFFFSDAEKRAIDQALCKEDYMARTITYWTRKEALSKLLGLGMKMDFKNRDTTADTLVNSAGGDSIRLHSFICNDFCLSLAVEDKIS